MALSLQAELIAPARARSVAVIAGLHAGRKASEERRLTLKRFGREKLVGVSSALVR